MSSKSNTPKQIYSAKKPCCKVCVDAGKPENVFSSHYVKDLNGFVTCPLLLSQECRTCHRKGHTTSFCPNRNQQRIEEFSRKPPVSPPKKEVPAPKKSNVFAYLEMNSDESDDEQEEFPDLVTAEPKNLLEKEVSAPKKFSYASMASKTQTEYKIEQLKETKTTPFVDKKFQVLIPKVWPTLAPGEKKSWVQMCDEDSSSEEEEFDEDNSAW
jgi:hypothetical protein